MRKWFSLSFILVFFGMLFTTNLGAVCPTPPPDDYPDVPFIGPTQVIFTTPEGCHVQYEYCYRIAGGKREFYIDVISVWGDGPNNICAQYMNPTDLSPNMRALIEVCASNMIFYHNPWGVDYPLDIPLCCPPSGGPRCWTDEFVRMAHAMCFGPMVWDLFQNRWMKTFCGLPGVCWNNVKFCYTMEPDAQGIMHTVLHMQSEYIGDDGTTCNSFMLPPVPCYRYCE